MRFFYALTNKPEHIAICIVKLLVSTICHLKIKLS